jgi:hypothetical protein
MVFPIIKIKEYILQFQSIADTIDKSMNFKFIDMENRCISYNDNNQKTQFFIRQFYDLQMSMNLHIKEIDKMLTKSYSEIEKFKKSNSLKIENLTEEIITRDINNEKNIIIDMKNKLKIYNIKICCSDYINKIKNLIKKEDLLNEKINIISAYVNVKNKNSDMLYFEKLYNNIKIEINAITSYFILDMNTHYNTFY